MKGIIFTTLNKLVEDRFGMKLWDQIINETDFQSGGIFTSGGTYPDSDLLGIVGNLSKLTKTSVDDLVFAFGQFALGQFAKLYPVFFKNADLKQFLLKIDSIIHVEVKKLYPDAVLPSISYEDQGPSKLIIKYQSPRKLCRLAEGLIMGASEYFKEPVTIQHSECMLHGNTHCRLELNIQKGE